MFNQKIVLLAIFIAIFIQTLSYFHIMQASPFHGNLRATRRNKADQKPESFNPMLNELHHNINPSNYIL